MTPYTKKIVELHKIHKAIENCGCNKDDGQGGGDSGNLLMSLIPNEAPKPDLFLYKRDFDDNNPIDVTNYKIDDLFNLCQQEISFFLEIMCLYESSNLNTIVGDINFSIDKENSSIGFTILPVLGTITSREVSYNDKIYYYYYADMN